MNNFVDAHYTTASSLLIFFLAVIQELKEEIRVRQEYLDTANDQIQVDKHQLIPDFFKVGEGYNFIVIMFVLVQLKSVPE